MPDEVVHDAPRPGRRRRATWGSDLLADVLRRLDVPYLANVPGSSYRGLHDSVVVGATGLASGWSLARGGSPGGDRA